MVHDSRRAVFKAFLHGIFAAKVILFKSKLLFLLNASLSLTLPTSMSLTFQTGIRANCRPTMSESNKLTESVKNRSLALAPEVHHHNVATKYSTE